MSSMTPKGTKSFQANFQSSSPHFPRLEKQQVDQNSHLNSISAKMNPTAKSVSPSAFSNPNANISPRSLKNSDQVHNMNLNSSRSIYESFDNDYDQSQQQLLSQTVTNTNQNQNKPQQNLNMAMANLNLQTLNANSGITHSLDSVNSAFTQPPPQGNYMTPLDSVISSASAFNKNYNYATTGSASSQTLNTGTPSGNQLSGLSTNSTAFHYKNAKQYEKKTNLEMSLDSVLDLEASEKLPMLLKKYILKKCSLNEWCRKQDFDGTALDGLNRLFFIQALQAVEHYAASVSEKIQKKPAYLMGILRGQESHWDNSRAAAQLEGGSVQLLSLPGRICYQVGLNCLDGNCLPSDFTPEVLLSLHSLTVKFALKAIQAFNSNKRIAAGCRGGVVNRPRFLQRLVENVIAQNPIIVSGQALERDLLNNGSSSKFESFETFENFDVVSGTSDKFEAEENDSSRGEKSEGHSQQVTAAQTEEILNVTEWKNKNLSLTSNTSIRNIREEEPDEPQVSEESQQLPAQLKVQNSPPGFENHPLSSVYKDSMITGMSSMSPKSSKSLFSMLGAGSHSSPDSLMELLNATSFNSANTSSQEYFTAVTSQSSDLSNLSPEERSKVLEDRVKALEVEIAKRILNEEIAKKEMKNMKQQVAVLENECNKLKITMNDVIRGIKDKILFGVQNTFNDINSEFNSDNQRMEK